MGGCQWKEDTDAQKYKVYFDYHYKVSNTVERQ